MELGMCDNDLYLLLGSTGVSFLLFLSEVLPFLSNTNGNGILHGIVKILQRPKTLPPLPPILPL